MAEEFKNQRKHTDGEIYRKIRQYEHEQNGQLRQRWFARLSQSNQKRFEQLDNPKNRRLRNGLDALLTIPGLWGGMRLSMIHRLVAVDCIEVCGVIIDFFGLFNFVPPPPLRSLRSDIISGDPYIS